MIHKILTVVGNLMLLSLLILALHTRMMTMLTGGLVNVVLPIHVCKFPYNITKIHVNNYKL
jgi:hypothetical protein